MNDPINYIEEYVLGEVMYNHNLSKENLINLLHKSNKNWNKEDINLAISRLINEKEIYYENNLLKLNI